MTDWKRIPGLIVLSVIAPITGSAKKQACAFVPALCSRAQRLDVTGALRCVLDSCQQLGWLPPPAGASVRLSLN